MKKELLVFDQQHQLVNGDITKEIAVSIYKGKAFRKAKMGGLSQVVEITAYRIEVEEVWYWDNQSYRHLSQDFGYCTARSGEFKYALRRIREECFSLDDVRILMADLTVDFSVAMNKDARKELKQQLRFRELGIAPRLPQIQRV